MSDRITYAETYYQNLLTGQFGLQEVFPCTVVKAIRINATPAFTFYLDRIKFNRLLIASNNVISALKTLHWVGILWVADSGLAYDSARLIAYPIIGQIRGLLDGSLVSYSLDPQLAQEMVEPAYTTEEGSLSVAEPGRYAWMLSWEYGMQFTKGVQV